MINLQYSTIQDKVPDFVYDDIKSFLVKSNTYHPQAPELIQMLSERYNLPQEHFFISAGSDESIMALKRVYGKNIFYFPPTYIEYSTTNGSIPLGNFHPIPSFSSEKYTITTEALSQHGLIFLANPNNPYGYTPKERILELVENNPTSIVVVDEAYSSFLEESMLDEVPRKQNLVVLRSFSKDYGLAGMRIGFIAASPSILEEITKSVQETNVSYASVGAALSAMSHQAHYDTLIEGIIKRRERFVGYLHRNKINYFDSKINVAVLALPNKKESSALFNYLKKNGITASYGNGHSNVGLSDSHIRITIGSEDQMNAVEQAIDNYLKERE